VSRERFQHQACLKANQHMQEELKVSTSRLTLPLCGFRTQCIWLPHNCT